MFGDVPQDAKLLMELAAAKENFKTICRQFDDLKVIYEQVKLENAYLRRQLEID